MLKSCIYFLKVCFSSFELFSIIYIWNVFVDFCFLFCFILGIVARDLDFLDTGEDTFLLFSAGTYPSVKGPEANCSFGDPLYKRKNTELCIQMNICLEWKKKASMSIKCLKAESSLILWWICLCFKVLNVVYVHWIYIHFIYILCVLYFWLHAIVSNSFYTDLYFLLPK